MDEQSQNSMVDLDEFNTLRIVHELTMGDLLIATLLTILIVFYLVKWLHGLIMRRD